MLTGLAAGAVAVGASVPSGQVPPPPETNAYVLVDVGDVPVPLACPCIARPFKVPAAEIGARETSGPGGPQALGELTEAELRRHNRHLQGRGVNADPYQAYFWATMARQRTPPGPLLEQANAIAAAAGRSLSASLIEDAERMVKDVLSASTHR